MLASLFVKENDKLRADFQEIYHLNLDDMGRDYSVSHAAALASELPETSRVMLSQAPELAWTVEHRLLACIEYWTHWLVWQKTKDGEKNRNKPKMLNPFEKKKVEHIGEAVSRERLFEIFGH